MVYMIIDSKSILLCIPDEKLLQGLFEHERLKPAQLKQVLHAGKKLS